MKQRIIATALFALFACFSSPAFSQSINVEPLPSGCGTGNILNGQGYLTEALNGQLCVNATVSASISGFTPGGAFATLTATNTAGTVALPGGTVVAFQNTGTTTVSCTVNTGSAAVANEIQVPASSTVFITVGANTSGSCIDQIGSTSNLVVLAGGSGLGTGFGGGSGGSGGTVNQGTPNGGGASAWPVVDSAVASALTTGLKTAPNITPTDCSGTITTGNTAQSAISAQTTLHGFTIANVDSAHNDEVLWISFTTTAAAQTAGSYPLPPPTATTFASFGSYTTPVGFGTNHAVSIIGATTGHVFSCTWW